jgi:hypothetical protein
MFELITPTEATLTSVTPRQEHHGEDKVLAVSLGLKITGPNTLLDKLSPTLRETLYTAVPDQEQLPGVEPSTPLLRAKQVIEQLVLSPSFEGWTLHVDHGIEEDDPISMSACKVDKFKLRALEGGTIELLFRIGTNDVSTEEAGILCSKLGQQIMLTLIAPITQKETPIDGSVEAFEKDHPTQAPLLDATDIFVDQHGDDEEDIAPPAPKKGRGRKREAVTH